MIGLEDGEERKAMIEFGLNDIEALQILSVKTTPKW